MSAASDKAPYGDRASWGFALRLPVDPIWPSIKALKLIVGITPMYPTSAGVEPAKSIENERQTYVVAAGRVSLVAG